MVRFATYRIQGIIELLVGGFAATAAIEFGVPEIVSVYIGLGITATIDIVFRMRNRGFESPLWDPEAGGTVWGIQVWVFCILSSIFIAVLYSGLLS